MNAERNQRPHRTPPDSAEMARRLALREQRNNLKIEAFKKSKSFQLLNILNVSCFFVYCELIFCFMSVCHFTTITPQSMEIKYGAKIDSRGFKYVRHINLQWYNEKHDQVIVEDFVEAPLNNKFTLHTGRDFILQKDLKVKLADGNSTYRLANASPVLFLSLMFSVVTLTAFYFNLNQQLNTLSGITFLNLLIVFAILFV